MSVNGVPGLYCAPPCNTVPGYDCDPAKVSGVTTVPECMIAVNATDNNYCALICNTDASDNQCDAKGGAKCHHVYGNQGVCTYTRRANQLAGAPRPSGRFNPSEATARRRLHTFCSN